MKKFNNQFKKYFLLAKNFYKQGLFMIFCNFSLLVTFSYAVRISTIEKHNNP